MRAQRAGHIITITSTAGLIGQEFCTAYAASKFAVEGWMESLRPEVAPYGIHTTVVEPGYFRTELLTPESDHLRRRSIDDYAERTAQTIGPGTDERSTARRPRQARREPADHRRPRQAAPRWVAGADAVEAVEQKARELLAQADAYANSPTTSPMTTPPPKQDTAGSAQTTEVRSASRCRTTLIMALAGHEEQRGLVARYDKEYLMKHVSLGGLDVSRIGLGAMTMAGTYTTGGGLDDAESIRTIHRALDLGVTHIDTAEIYGPFHSEEIVGKAIKGRRDGVVWRQSSVSFPTPAAAPA